MRSPHFKALLLTASVLAAAASPARADVVAQSINTDFPASDYNAWGGTDVGWLYTPSASYELTGVETEFSDPINTPVLDRTITVGLWTGVPASGGQLLGSFTFNSASAEQQLGGGDFASAIPLAAGTTYFVGFENVGILSGGELGVNFVDNGQGFGNTSALNPAATFLSNLYIDGDDSASFAGEDTNTDSLGQPILAFLEPDPATSGPSPVPEPGALALTGAGLTLIAARRGRAPRR